MWFSYCSGIICFSLLQRKTYILIAKSVMAFVIVLFVNKPKGSALLLATQVHRMETEWYPQPQRGLPPAVDQIVSMKLYELRKTQATKSKHFLLLYLSFILFEVQGMQLL